eukprot:2448510-Amphidinium_carterae.1
MMERWFSIRVVPMGGSAHFRWKNKPRRAATCGVCCETLLVTSGAHAAKVLGANPFLGEGVPLLVGPCLVARCAR